MSTYTEDELSGMTRADLDSIAEDLELDPGDYSTKADEVAAIVAAQDGSTDVAEGGEEPVESPGFAGLDIATLALGEGEERKPVILGPDEHFLLTSESWVILGVDASVPDWAVGMPAFITSAPVSTERDANGDPLYTFTDPDAVITVRERSQGAQLSIPLKSVQKLSVTGGRGEVVNHP